MFEQVLSFIIKYKFVFLFYLAITIFLITKRKKLDFQAKVIILFRTKFGLRWMEKFTNRFREWIILVGYIGVGAGYVGLVFISYVLIKNIYDMIVNPIAISGVSIVLPGINIPGLGVLPFWHWLIAIFVIASVHEFSHGIVARAHKIEVKSTGVVFLGPIIGAFVEPNEKKMAKESDIKQYSVLAAGPFSNIILALVAIVLMMFVFMPIQDSMVDPNGFTFSSYYDENFPAAKAELIPGTIITGVNGEITPGFGEFAEEMYCHKPGDIVKVNTKNGTYPLTLVESPDNQKKGFLGITEIQNDFELKEKYKNGWGEFVYGAIDWLVQFFKWLFILSLGIGLFNLLPLPIVDGGRMMQITLHKIKGKEKGEKRYHQISMFFLLILVISIVYPLISKLWL
jgi:membrane-associated protease RseP (regulator of RpoE activity)